MKFRLKSAHYLDGDVYLPGDAEMGWKGDEAGTIIGDGTPYKVKWPTLEMEPLDEEAEKFLEKERHRLTTNEASMNPVEELSMDSYEREYVPAFNTRRRPALPDGAPVKK
jgi:hypothetical protein